MGLDLLTTDDVPKLTNGNRLPIVIALACLNGMFQSLFPEESLAEALVRAPNGGAVGVWASSGITSPQWQWRMNVELYRQIFQGGWLTIGEAMRAAKAVVGDPDVRRTWIYFGDPVDAVRRTSGATRNDDRWGRHHANASASGRRARTRRQPPMLNASQDRSHHHRVPASGSPTSTAMDGPTCSSSSRSPASGSARVAAREMSRPCQGSGAWPASRWPST